MLGREAPLSLSGSYASPLSGADSNSKYSRRGRAWPGPRQILAAAQRAVGRLARTAPAALCNNPDRYNLTPQSGTGAAHTRSWGRMVPWSLVLLLALALIYVVHVDGAQRSNDEATLERLQRASEIQAQQQEEVRAKLQSLQASMLNVDTVMRSLQDRLAAREIELASLQADQSMLQTRLHLCQARMNQSSDASALLGQTLATTLERMGSLIPEGHTEMTLMMEKARATVDSLQQHMRQAAAMTVQEAEEAQAQLQQQQQQQQQQREDEMRQAVAAAAAAAAAVAAESAAQQPPPPPPAAPAFTLTRAPEVLPVDPATHPEHQIHFVKELPLHQQPEHIRPAATLSSVPAAPFPSQYKSSVAAESARRYIASLPTEAERTAEGEAQVRGEEVKAEFLHAWRGYKEHAWGFDELHPLSRKGSNSQYYMSLTMIDALDSLVLMGLEDEYVEVRQYLRDYLIFTEQEEINLFETTIRVIGGLLSAYALTGDQLFAHQAEECARRMLVAFDTPTGLPFGTVGLRTAQGSNPSWSAGASTIAEVGSIQLEWSYLTEITGDDVFRERVDRVTQRIGELGRELYTQFINVNSGKLASSVITLGARVDSIYEYFLKGFVQYGGASSSSSSSSSSATTAGEEQLPQQLYRRAMRGLERELVHVVPDGPESEGREPITFIAEKHNGALSGKMDHLVCFVPGMLALGAHARAVPVDDATRHMKLAAQLMRTCHEMYARQATGLAPEICQFELDAGKASAPGARAFQVDAHAAHSMLRPETVESLYILWRVTKDPLYREWAWEIFKAMRTYGRVEGGYSGLKDVRRADRPADPQVEWSNHNDKMESFYLAETLKYLWLIQQPDTVLPIDQWVLNTEAHPLPISGAQQHAPPPAHDSPAEALASSSQQSALEEQLPESVRKSNDEAAD